MLTRVSEVKSKHFKLDFNLGFITYLIQSLNKCFYLQEKANATNMPRQKSTEFAMTNLFILMWTNFDSQKEVITLAKKPSSLY